MKYDFYQMIKPLGKLIHVGSMELPKAQPRMFFVARKPLSVMADDAIHTPPTSNYDEILYYLTPLGYVADMEVKVDHS